MLGLAVQTVGLRTGGSVSLNIYREVHLHFQGHQDEVGNEGECYSCRPFKSCS